MRHVTLSGRRGTAPPPHLGVRAVAAVTAAASLTALALVQASAAASQAAAPPAVLAQTAAPQAAPAAAATAPLPWWPQFDFDERHTGVNNTETTIYSGNVATLHLLYQVTLPAIADGAPAFLPQVTTPQGMKDLLFLTTKDGRLLALDAATGATVWSAQPATGPNFTTSSPAIDPDRTHVYSYGLEGRVHKYTAADGTEVTGGGWPEVATLKPQFEKCSPALAIATSSAAGGATRLYVANGGYPDDAGDYQGHLTTIDLASGAQRVWNAMCSARHIHLTAASPDCGALQGAIWGRPGVVYDPDTDEIYFATGNGPFAPGAHDWGDSILALRGDGTSPGPGPLDSFTPPNFQELQDDDLDQGSSGMVVLAAPPGSRVPHLGAQTGKDAKIRLFDLDNLSGSGAPGATSGELQELDLPQGNQVLPQPAAWVNPVDGSTWTFIANFNGISGLQLTLDAGGNPSLVPVWTNRIAGSSPLIANGMLFYAATGVGLEALDPTTGAVLWIDTAAPNPHWHWESPIVVAGRVFVTDESALLRAYASDSPPLVFHPLASCRVIDTRSPIGGPRQSSLRAGAPARLFQIAGLCGVPAAARAVRVTVTAVRATAAGDLRLGPFGVAVQPAVTFGLPQTSSRIQQLLLTGNPAGAIGVQADLPPGGKVDLLLNVTGYYD